MILLPQWLFDTFVKLFGLDEIEIWTIVGILYVVTMVNAFTGIIAQFYGLVMLKFLLPVLQIEACSKNCKCLLFSGKWKLGRFGTVNVVAGTDHDTGLFTKFRNVHQMH